MKLSPYLQAIILFLLSNIPLLAQNEQLKITSIPIKLIEDNKHILINAKVNNDKEFVFYFDTGAASSLLDKESAKTMNIEPNYEQEIDGAGGKVKYQIALNQNINIGLIKLDSVNLVLENLTRLKNNLGHNFDGIIGYDLLKNYISEIDIDNEKINLYPRKAKLDLTGYTTQPFTLDRGINIPQIEVEIELKNKEKLKGTIFFDSGAGLTLLINSPFKEENKLVQKSKKILTSHTENLSTRSKNEQIALKSLTFGGHTFYNVPIGLTSDEAGVSSYKGYLGILGSEIIHKFNIVLDYDAKLMYLKPNKLYKLPFSIPLTGFSLKNEDEKGIIISRISKESPAYKKGIREGDQLIKINGMKNLTIEEYNTLLKKEGKKIKITLKNKSGIKTYKLKLKKLL